MREGKIKAVARQPYLSREESKNYEANDTLWRLNDFHQEHGGSPIITGIVTLLDATVAAKRTPRYKLEFPDGFVDYARVDNFDDFYVMDFFIQ